MCHYQNNLPVLSTKPRNFSPAGTQTYERKKLAFWRFCCNHILLGCFCRIISWREKDPSDSWRSKIVYLCVCCAPPFHPLSSFDFCNNFHVNQNSSVSMLAWVFLASNSLVFLSELPINIYRAFSKWNGNSYINVSELFIFSQTLRSFDLANTKLINGCYPMTRRFSFPSLSLTWTCTHPLTHPHYHTLADL